MTRIVFARIQPVTRTLKRLEMGKEGKETQHLLVLSGWCESATRGSELLEIEIPRDEIKNLLNQVVFDDTWRQGLAALLRDVIQTELSTCLQRPARD